MLITIPEDFQSFVSRGVASGRFRSEEEAVCEGLNLLRDRERKLEALRAELQVGIEQLDAGQSIRLDIEDIKHRGRQRLANVIFYRPVSDGIEVARVLHGARDIQRL